jgi:transcriptional regulator with XRE-family HTH domain
MDAQCGTPSAPTEKKTGRHSTLTPEIHEKILGFVRKGLTYEKAGEALGISPATIQNWQHRNKAFNESLQKARRGLEANLLDSINQAGEKSWQARAWILERSFSYSQPSARLNVTQDVTHGLSSNLAQLLAGIAGRKKITATPEKRQIESGHNYIDIQPVTTKPENHLSNNKYCINKTNSVEQQEDTQAKTPKVRHKRMRQRKPRAESLAKYPPTTTPPATPPAPI